MKVRLVGLTSLVADLEAAGEDINDLRATFAQIGQELVLVSRRIQPDATGRIDASTRASRRKSEVVVSAGGAKAPYTGFHYGYPPTRHTPEHPTRALYTAAGRVDVAGMVADGVEAALNRHGLT